MRAEGGTGLHGGLARSDMTISLVPRNYGTNSQFHVCPFMELCHGPLFTYPRSISTPSPTLLQQRTYHHNKSKPSIPPSFPMPLHRALIKTHHMTSRKKIQTIAKAAKSLHCSVVIKTGRPPGVMLVEATNDSETEAKKAVEAWVGVVRRLRYKDYQLLKMEGIVTGGGRLGVEAGCVREFDEMKELGKFFEECGVRVWWREHMGFARGGG